ncbi:MAG: hypothetical protein L0228_04315 [Planctomycetes bacterium]|nr:hypothetical protein [Planctomycetota bacterium]
MATKHRNTDLQEEVRRRAADVRRQWSPLETIRRTGLPPDVPALLRQFILGERQPAWSTAVCRREPKADRPVRAL